MPQLINSDNLGLLVDPGDAQTLADALAWVFENRFAAEQMGCEARMYVNECYSPGKWAKKLEDIYYQAVNHG